MILGRERYKEPWIQEKFLWNVVNTHSQISCSSKINNLKSTRACSSGHKTHVFIPFSTKGSRTKINLPSEKIMF